MFNPTTGTTTDPDRDIFESPARTNPIAVTVALLLTAALLGAILWMTPSDDTTAATTIPVETTVVTNGGAS